MKVFTSGVLWGVLGTSIVIAGMWWKSPPGFLRGLGTGVLIMGFWWMIGLQQDGVRRQALERENEELRTRNAKDA